MLRIKTKEASSLWIALLAAAIVGIVLGAVHVRWGYALVAVSASFCVVFFAALFIIRKYVAYKLKPIYSIVLSRDVHTNEIFSELKDKRVENIGEELTAWADTNDREIARLKEAERFRKQYLGNVAHELKTPVSSIQGYLETIISNPELPDDKRQFFLERCYSQSTRLTGLLRDISVLNRLDEASEMFELSEVNIRKLVGEIEKECSKEMEEKKITTEVVLPGNPSVYGNYSLLYSIFRNLYDNAIAYAGEGIRITVNCYKEDPKFYYFSFSDNGVGVSEEHVNRIFERFYRVDKGRSRKVGGTGLGLSIVKNGVNFHKGQISAKSGLGKGMTFFFTIKKKI